MGHFRAERKVIFLDIRTHSAPVGIKGGTLHWWIAEGDACLLVLVLVLD